LAKGLSGGQYEQVNTDDYDIANAFGDYFTASVWVCSNNWTHNGPSYLAILSLSSIDAGSNRKA